MPMGEHNIWDQCVKTIDLMIINLWLKFIIVKSMVKTPYFIPQQQTSNVMHNIRIASPWW